MTTFTNINTSFPAYHKVVVGVPKVAMTGNSTRCSIIRSLLKHLRGGKVHHITELKIGLRSPLRSDLVTKNARQHIILYFLTTARHYPHYLQGWTIEHQYPHSCHGQTTSWRVGDRFRLLDHQGKNGVFLRDPRPLAGAS